MTDQIFFEAPALDAGTADALAHARLHDPFGYLGPHDTPQGRIIRVYVPGAAGVDVLSRDGRFIGALLPAEPPGLFAARVGAKRVFAVDDSPIVEVAREVWG